MTSLYAPVRPAAGVAVAEIARGAAAPPLVCRWSEGGRPRGFILFLHGLGASGRDYAELSACWAAHGYLVIHPTFPDWVGAVAAAEPGLFGPDDDPDRWTGNDRIRARMHRILHDPRYWLERVRIVRAALDSLEELIAETCGGAARGLPGAVAGHSFGAYTAQLFAGAEIDLPGQGALRFGDDRFGASILLSPQGRDQQGLREGSWNGLAGPALIVTGTRDGGAKGQDWRWKTEPYEFAPAGGKHLAVLTGADHYLGGIARPEQSPQPAHMAGVKALTLAFLDAYLAGDEAAKVWLAAVDGEVGASPLLFRRK